MIDNDVYYKTKGFEDNNNNEVYNIERTGNQHAPCDVRTIPSSNVNHGSEEYIDNPQHNTFCNNDWEEQYHEDNFLTYEDEEQYNVEPDHNFDNDYFQNKFEPITY